MLIREIKKVDNEAIKIIIQESLASHGLAIPGSAYFDPQLGELYEHYTLQEQGKYWVVEQEGRVVGGCGIGMFNKQEKICELQKLYLIPEVQGRGISKQLMDTALDYAAKYYQSCYLETMAELATACRLYEKYGFTKLNQPLEGSEHSAMDRWYLKEL